ncbi:acyltransferase family protein [Pseudarthrobacter sulfonivorans]|uniref:acyltransferase family protein n=1 Tax=Pseudarthrobacter sulfonivorans TaxID=121292 RepID=UPI0028594DD9|nr:peptidoglycan/LPS O-acetylase OafA/YrhL [Pseudarthrobacter sulfonivorans]
MNTNLSLNAMRTVAAFLVVISHLRTLFFVDFGISESTSVPVQIFYLISSMGHPAVIVFFVLSGYWVGGSVLRQVGNGTFSWSAYCISRMTRLWLVLIPVIALTQLLDRIGAWASPTSSIYSGSAAYHSVIPAAGPLPTLGTLETLGNLFFLQSIYTATLGTNSPLWSLAYEFWYYAIFPALIITFSRYFSVKKRVYCLLFTIGGCALAGPSVLAMFPAWIVGAIVAWRRDQIASWLNATQPLLLACLRFSSVAAVGVVASAVILLGDGSTGLLLFVVLPSAIMLGLHTTDVAQGRQAIRPLSWAAEWSYTLYAIHVPIIALLASLLVPVPTARWQVSPTSILAALAIVLCVSAVAFTMSLVTERNTTRVRRRIGNVLSREPRHKGTRTLTSR